ncbi:hypothetical protein HDV00_002392 [Rhizophlyctis rosea]|nr:hypothetical protein HDV00_002392 [Rhizophlyctis rosea]
MHISRVSTVLALASMAAAKVQYTGTNESGLEFGDGNNTDYTNPDPNTVTYWKSVGANVYRMGFTWERAQPAQNGALDETYMSYLDKFIKPATAAGQIVMLEPHNYARYRGGIVGSAVPSSAMADFWTKLANRYKSNPNVWFDIMNEPHDLPTQQWFSAAQDSINAIRKAGFNNKLLVPGIAWTGAWSWVSSGNSGVAGTITDPSNNWAYDMHQYFDSDYSGTNKVCSHGTEVFTAATNWLRSNGKKAFLGEWAVSTDSSCSGMIDKVAQYLNDNSDVWIGWTWWASGPWWGDYMFSLEPTSGTSGDKPQMAQLKKWFVGNGGGGSTTPTTTTRAQTTTTRAQTSTTRAQTTTVRTTTTTRTGGSTNCASLYGQCGGQGWTGATCCSQGTCKVSNQWYSQCLN